MLLNCGVGENSESPLDCKEIQGLQEVHPKGNQSWLFIGRNDVEAETPIPWLPDTKNWLIWKDPDAGKDWRQEEKGTTEDEMVGWHHQLNGRESEWTPRVGDGQGGLECCSPWGHKGSGMTEWLNWTNSHKGGQCPGCPLIGWWVQVGRRWFQEMISEGRRFCLVPRIRVPPPMAPLPWSDMTNAQKLP